jgi:GntR family transcriptional regulator, rspAB operon transcriptional repressor
MVAANLQAHGNKAERVYEALRSEFVHGEWTFGQSFSTYELAERFRVSRRPVMDALQRLQTDGFVEIIPQVGCRVVLPEESRVRDHLELSAILFGPAARKAAERADEAAVSRLRDIYAALVPVVARRDFEGYQTLQHEFRRAILDIAGNLALASLAEDATDLWEFYFHPYRRQVNLDVLDERLSDHRDILEAIEARDGAVAQSRMEAHLNPERVLELIRRFAGHDVGTAVEDGAVAQI